MFNNRVAAPLYYQQLEQSFNLNPLLNYIEQLYNIPIQSSSEDADDENEDTKSPSESLDFYRKSKKKKFHSEQDKRTDKLSLYNFSRVNSDREWLQELLMKDDTSDNSSDESVTEEEIRREMKFYLLRKKYRRHFYSNSENKRYRYYSTGLLSTFDLYDNPYSCNVKDEVEEENKQQSKKRKYNKTGKYKKNSSEHNQDGSENLEHNTCNKLDIKPEVRKPKFLPSALQIKNKLKKKALHVQVMTARRRKLWALMVKKEVCKVQRHRTNRCKEIQINFKKIAQHCMKFSRQKAMQSEKCTKEISSRARRLTREMQSYWKKYDRVERETRRRLEKEAEEQRKMDVEFMEVKRQQRKLNFLITQTELYAHFMSKKLGQSTYEDQIKILNQLEEEKGPRVLTNDDYDSEILKKEVQQNVQLAFEAEQLRSSQFDDTLPVDVGCVNEERPQPKMFKGSLKHYQLKGMNWLANLYDQGINGILADEMGLGKTVQSIAFLCHIAEKYSLWGPFLIISPSSTLHNWQQEMARFIPDFKVVPYWGNPQERKILRQFWNSKDLHTQDASFHVVITSYQLVITDIKYFNRIQWQYVILDEAQAIKSTNSVRWKSLLSFNCRNRLLLSGTPIQNSMAELWALLHFIMPSMFDSHNEFNEWFSKDIESHAENKTSIDEKHLTRLHLILKPFMLRRIKKDVENELSDKIEIMVYCPLTSRQKILYAALRKKIRIEDLLHSPGTYQSQTITSNLMNLVMQFRKVCNHPELFERREAKSPYFMKSEDYVIPKLIFDDCFLHRLFPSRDHILYNMLNIFAPEYVQKTLFPNNSSKKEKHFNCFAFTRLMDLSPQELNRIALGDLIFRWLHIVCQLHRRDLMLYRQQWWEDVGIKNVLIPLVYDTLKKFRLTAPNGPECVFSYGTEIHHGMPETMEHRLIRSRSAYNTNLDDFAGRMKKTNTDDASIRNEIASKVQLLPEFPHVYRKPTTFECHPMFLPFFVYQQCPKIAINSKELYCASRRAAWYSIDHKNCTNEVGKNCVWYSSPSAAKDYKERSLYFQTVQIGGFECLTPPFGWSNILIPDKQTLLSDASKLSVLDSLLKRLKEEGHRVLIFSQMTRMIDLLEEYMWFRKHKYMRLDGSSKISDRRDMVANFQTRSEIFVFLLSTRAGGLGINLTAADTVIFYDSDWNPTVDQQAMDRTHRLGQTKQVTVYRLICKNTIEERMLQRAREKCEIQRMVISGGGSKPDMLKPKEVVSLLLDDEDIEKTYRLKQLERRQATEEKLSDNKELEKKRKFNDNESDSNSGPSEMGEISADINEGGSETKPIETDAMFYSATGESQNMSKRGRSTKRGRPFSRNLPGRPGGTNNSPSNANVVNSLKDKQILTRRARGRPRLSRGGPLNHMRSSTGRVKSTYRISPSKTVIPVNPYSDLQIVPSDVS